MSDANTGPEAPSGNEQADPDVITSETDSGPAEDDTERQHESDSEALDKARREAKNLRDRAKTAEARVDELSRTVFALKVTALDKLADPGDFDYDADLIDDDEALAAAVDELISRRPHYAKPRKPNGSVGQGQRGNNTGPQNFSSLLR